MSYDMTPAASREVGRAEPCPSPAMSRTTSDSAASDLRDPPYHDPTTNLTTNGDDQGGPPRHHIPSRGIQAGLREVARARLLIRWV